MHVPVHVKETSSNFRRIINGSLIRLFTLDVDYMLRNTYESNSLAVEVKQKLIISLADHGFLISDGGRRKPDI